MAWIDVSSIRKCLAGDKDRFEAAEEKDVVDCADTLEDAGTGTGKGRDNAIERRATSEEIDGVRVVFEQLDQPEVSSVDEADAS